MSAQKEWKWWYFVVAGLLIMGFVSRGDDGSDDADEELDADDDEDFA